MDLGTKDAGRADDQLTKLCCHVALPNLGELDLDNWLISNFGMWQLTQLTALTNIHLLCHKVDILEMKKFCDEMHQKNCIVDTQHLEESY